MYDVRCVMYDVGWNWKAKIERKCEIATRSTCFLSKNTSEGIFADDNDGSFEFFSVHLQLINL